MYLSRYLLAITNETLKLSMKIISQCIQPHLFSLTRYRRLRVTSFSSLRKISRLVSDPSLMDIDNAPSNFAQSAHVYPNVVTTEEEELILKDLESKMRRWVFIFKYQCNRIKSLLQFSHSCWMYISRFT